MRMASVGDNCVDRYLEEGIGFPGGSAVNTAVFAARRGVSAAYFGVVGTDPEGETILTALREENVDVTGVRVLDEPTSVSDIRIDEVGNRIFTGFVPSVTVVVLTEAELASLTGCDWIHTGHSSRTIGQIPQLSHIAPVVFDFSYTDVETVGDAIAHITIAGFSRESASEDECLNLAQKAVALGARMAVVTRGAEGAVASNGEQSISHPAAEVTVVDTIGAGDAFQTGFAHATLDGASITDALTEATNYAGLVCTYRGAFGHPTPLRKGVLRGN